MYSHASNRLQKQDQSIEHVLPMEYTQGTDYNMYFQDTKVTDIASHIEKKFEVEVTLEGRIRSCVLTADFTDQSGIMPDLHAAEQALRQAAQCT